MAKLKDKELEEVNGAGKAQMDAWDLVFKTFASIIIEPSNQIVLFANVYLTNYNYYKMYGENKHHNQFEMS